MYKPTDYTSLAPYLIVDDASATLAFVHRVFGADPLFVHRDDHGRIAHAEVRIDDTVLMLGQMPDGPDAHLHVYVPDVDASFALALAAGGQSVQAPEEKGDGDRRGGVRAPDGTTWWLSTALVKR